MWCILLIFPLPRFSVAPLRVVFPCQVYNNRIEHCGTHDFVVDPNSGSKNGEGIYLGEDTVGLSIILPRVTGLFFCVLLVRLR